MENDEKNDEEPKVKDLTGEAEQQLSDQSLDGVSGGKALNCGGGNRTCTHLVIAAKKAETLTVLLTSL